jgi:hypothetical protein
MLGNDPAEERLAGEIAEDARLAAKEREAVLEKAGQVLGEPPAKVRSLVEKFDLDPDRPVGDDPQRLGELEKLVREGREAAGDAATEAERRLAPLLDPASPLSSKPCRPTPQRRRSSGV